MWPFRRSKEEKNKKEEAKAALEDACENLERIKKRAGEVTRVSSALRRTNERNGFAEALESIILYHGGPLDDKRR